MGNSDVIVFDEVVRKVYRRTDRDRPEREWRTLTLLHVAAPGLAPQPVRQHSRPRALEMTRIRGASPSSPLTPVQTAAVVAAYRRLFAVPVPSDLPLRFAPPDEFVARNLAWLDARDLGGLPDVVCRALQAAHQWHRDPPLGVNETHDPVVAQADGNIANMLWDGTRIHLVDFEYSGVGDLAFEVADLVEHVSSRLCGLLDPEAVLTGFGLTRSQSARVEQFRTVLATFWLLMLLPGSPGRPMNPAGSDERQAAHLLNRI